VLSSILTAVFTGIFFLAALRLLPPLHPVQVWSGSWAIAMALYALRLLPYRNLSWLTAGLICGGVAAFAAGAGLGDRLAGRRRVPRRVPEEVKVVALAAWLSVALLAVSLGAFLAQLVSKYGVSRVLRISPDVKLYLSGGEAPLSGAYVEVAIAAAAICALAAALATARGPRLRWLVAAAVCSGSVYFSTSRAFIVVALIVGLSALVLARMSVNRRLLATGALAAGIAAVAIFIGLGAVLGKTYGNSTIGGFDNFFSRHPAVSSLALPYQEVTASIPALDLLTRVSTTWGVSDGCATVPIACGVVRRLGVPAPRVPVTGPFTKVPLQWNGYTSLERFLGDGGTALALVLVAVSGLVAGYWWARARAGSAGGILIYAIIVPALVAAYRQNLIELVLVAACISVGLLLLARLLASLRDPFVRRAAKWVT
jgi:oligosaccharide repeat unit polymerase